jgi:thioredoxin reductase (NADPH)
MQEALTLADHLGKVILLERGEALTGQVPYREAVGGNPKIELRFGVTIEEILGDAAVAGVRIREAGSGSTSQIEAAAVFPCVGLVPNAALAQGLAPLDSSGRIRVDAAMRTSAPGLFAVGNVREGSPHRAAGAMGDGAAAAVALDRFLAGGVWRDPG